MRKIISLDPEATEVPFEENDWKRLGGTYVHHIPTKSMFVVECDPAKGSLVSVLDFEAQLMHVCKGKKVPEGDELIALGRAAIVFLLSELGMWPGKIVPEKPKVRKPPYPKYIN